MNRTRASYQRAARSNQFIFDRGANASQLHEARTHNQTEAVKRTLLTLALGVVLGVALVPLMLELAVAAYLGQVKFPYGAPHAQQKELQPCSEAAQRWRHGVCTDPLVDANAPFEPVSFGSARGTTVHAWWIPQGQPGAPTVVYAPGAGQDRREGLRFVSAVRAAGWAMLMLDLTNHGMSSNDGTGVRYGSREWSDVLAGAQWARSKQGASKVVCLGVSMGGASCIFAAARDEAALLDGVITEATYASITEVVVHQAERRHLPRVTALMVVDALHETMGPHTFATTPAGMVTAVSPRPWLQIVDLEDGLVPPWQSDLLFEMARQPKSRVDVPGAQHGQATHAVPDVVTPAIGDFLTQLVPPKDAAAPAPSPGPHP